MEYPKCPAETEARMKSAWSESEKRTSHVWRRSTEPQSSSEEPERQPKKGDKTGQDHRTTRNLRGQRNNSGEREVPALQNKKTLRTELQSFKGRDGQSLVRHRGGIHAIWKGRCLEQRPYRYAKNRRLDLTPGRGVRQRI